MKSFSALRVALEEIKAPVDQELLADDNMEANILQAAQQLDNHFDGVTTINSANDKAYQYSLATEAMLASGNCSVESLNFLRIGGEQYFNNQNFHSRIATEEFDNAQKGHEAALEDLRDYLMHGMQYYVIGFKQHKDFFSDLFRSSQSMLAKYEGIIGEAEAEYKEKNKTWKKNYHVASTVYLWFHFSNEDGGLGRNFGEVMKKDSAMSKYVLTVYPVKTLELLKKLSSTVKGGSIASIEKATALARSIENMEHPINLFDDKYVGGKPFLGATGLEKKMASPRTTIAVGGVSFPDLAKLAAPSKTVETVSVSHTAKKVVGKMGETGLGWWPSAGMIVHSVSTRELEMTNSEIDALIQQGKDYLRNVSEFMKLESRISSATDEFASALKHLISTADEEMSPSEKTKINQIVKQIEQYGTAILNCVQSPAAVEVARSLKSARYCGYLTKRLVWNAH